jgi:hypothetical protein
MQKFKLEDFVRGWFIGDFTPSIFRTPNFEVGVLHHHKDELWPAHYQKVATEFNVLLSGSLSINNEIILPGEIFIIEPLEIAVPIFHEDCKVLCIKVPSLPNDKFEVYKS